MRIQRNFIAHGLLVGMCGTVALENQSNTIGSRSCNLWGFIPWKKNLYSHNNLYMNVYNSFIHNRQKLGTTQMTLNRWMNKTTVVYPLMKYSTIKKWSMKAQNPKQRNKIQKNYKSMVSERLYQGYRLCDSIYMIFWKRQNY